MGKDWAMSLLVIGSFPLLMTIVLMIAVWMERFLDRSDELVPIEDYEPQLDMLSPRSGMSVPPARPALLSEPEV